MKDVLILLSVLAIVVLTSVIVKQGSIIYSLNDTIDEYKDAIKEKDITIDNLKKIIKKF